MSFKEQVAADLENVFLNLGEFADVKKVRYDGDVYDGVSVVFTRAKEEDRKIVYTSEHPNAMQGLYAASVVAHLRIADVGGVLPEKGRYIAFDDGTSRGAVFWRKFRIAESAENMGLARLDLEAIDE